MTSLGWSPTGAAPTAAVDAQLAALAHMSKALEYLDSDDRIPPIIAAHLQMAIDAMRRSSTKHPGSIDLHHG